ncbi:unnamed protein product [Cuscuta campestris]|uniref:Uncharacterized protein n=1 Tax=Cuscuta campestris TaxID=132261 RepID=A0A484LRX4_9ASTE|nr:unnamed protein product [Cuscuta campestris]
MAGTDFTASELSSPAAPHLEELNETRQKNENAVPVSAKIAELSESRQELLSRIQNLKQDLQSWRSKLDTQVKVYRDFVLRISQELSELKKSLNGEVDQLRSDFQLLKSTLQQQQEDVTASLRNLGLQDVAEGNKDEGATFGNNGTEGQDLSKENAKETPKSAMESPSPPRSAMESLDLCFESFVPETEFQDCGGEDVNFISDDTEEDEKSTEFKTGSHTEAVLGLAWNEEYRNVLASASADKSVKIWDVSKQICDITMNDHVDKARQNNYVLLTLQMSYKLQINFCLLTYAYLQVQAVAWNPFHPKILLSGSFDRSVILKDVRIPSHAGLKFSVAAQVESLKWDPHAENSFLVSLENGTISSFHLEAGADPNMKPSFTLHAHDKAVCSIAFNPLVPNLLATCSLDKTVKLWDLSGNQPSCIASRNPKAGALFSISFSNDYPYLLAMGGSEGKLEMWDILKEDAISKKYDQLARAKSKSK